jgi:hypothetical protein
MDKTIFWIISLSNGFIGYAQNTHEKNPENIINFVSIPSAGIWF